MKQSSYNTIKLAMTKIQEAIDLLEKVKGENENIDEAADSVGFAFADLEYEVNNN
jgi:prefoldin subunit 5